MRQRTQHRAAPAAARHTLRMEMVVEFDGPVSETAAREAARRNVDALQITGTDGQVGAHPGSRRLICHDLRRSVVLLPADAPPPDEQQD